MAFHKTRQYSQRSSRTISSTLALATALLVCCGLQAVAAERGSSSRDNGPPQKAKTRLPAASLKKPSQNYDVAPASADRRQDAKNYAAAIDGAVQSPLFQQGKRPNPLTDDETFLRRIYLDVAGRIPTLDEVESFLGSSDSDKRENLIDNLLSSEDYVSNMYNMWADTLRLHDKPDLYNYATPYLTYVRETIAENKPYDRWVYEMLTADGKMWENPATGFQLRDEGMPLPYVDNTVRVFLGTQIGCAQCHDHPFDSWTQYQFYQLAAFTTGVKTQHQSEQMAEPKDGKRARRRNLVGELIEEGKRTFPKGNIPGEFRRMVRANAYTVSETKRQLRLPEDYAYEDAKPNSKIEPEVLWGEIPSLSESSTGREQFAAWVTSKDNERFSNMVANRLWKRFIGIGVVEPIDDFRDENAPTNPELMKALGDQVRDLDFDLKQFVRGILYSDTYQAESSQYEITSGEPYDFAGPVMRRLTAEQVWDSMLTLAVPNTTPFLRPDADDFRKAIDMDLETASFQQAVKLSKRFKETLFESTYRKELNQYSYKGNILCRASELPVPLPSDHFLRQFGQGDREVIDGSDQSATVPQILAMFNGPITHVMLEPGSRIVDDIVSIPAARDRVDGIFKAVLARPPRSTDRRIVASELSRNRSDGVSYGNIIWALLNTREFLFVQ